MMIDLNSTPLRDLPDAIEELIKKEVESVRDDLEAEISSLRDELEDIREATND